MNEIQYQKKLQEAGEKRLWRCQRNHDSRKSSGRGWPDLTFARTGDILLWEVKMPNGDITGAQKEWPYQLLTSEGVMTIRFDFIYPEDWDYAIRTLDDPQSTLYEWQTERLPPLLYLLKQWEKERGNIPTRMI